ncbi:MAG: hypothetical protein QXO47_02925 [Thermoproteota archaeon]
MVVHGYRLPQLVSKSGASREGSTLGGKVVVWEVSDDEVKRNDET